MKRFAIALCVLFLAARAFGVACTDTDGQMYCPNGFSSDNNLPSSVYGTTAPQFSVGYDPNNTLDMTVTAGGDVTLAPSGGDTDIASNLYVGTNVDNANKTIVLRGDMDSDAGQTSYKTVTLGWEPSSGTDSYGPTITSSAGDLTLTSANSRITVGGWALGLTLVGGAGNCSIWQKMLQEKTTTNSNIISQSPGCPYEGGNYRTLVGRNGMLDINYTGTYGATFRLATSNSLTHNLLNLKQQLLTIGGDVLVFNPDTLGPEVLAETGFTPTVTKWVATGDASISAGGYVQYTKSAGTGTLTQASGNFAVPLEANSIYRFAYTVSSSNAEAGSVLKIPSTGVATADSYGFVYTNGAYVVYFRTNASPGDFALTFTIASGSFQLDDFSLKKVNNGDLYVVDSVNADRLLTHGTAPTLSTCGTSPSIAANSTDTAGIVTTGTADPNSCTITFATAYAEEPACTIMPQANVTAYLSASSASAITVTFSAAINSTKFNYICVGIAA